MSIIYASHDSFRVKFISCGRIPVIDNVGAKDLFWIKVLVRGCLPPMPWASGEAEYHIQVAIRDASIGGGGGRD